MLGKLAKDPEHRNKSDGHVSLKASLNSVISIGQGSDCGTAAGAALGVVGRWTHKALLAGNGESSVDGVCCLCASSKSARTSLG